MAIQGIELPVSLQIKNLQDIVDQLKKFAGKNILSESLGGKKIDKELDGIVKRLDQISAKSKTALNSQGSFTSIQRDVDAVELGLNRIQDAAKNLHFEDLKIPDDIQSKIDGLNARIKQLQNNLISFKGTQKEKIINDQTFLSNLNIAEGPAAAAKLLEKGYDELYKTINSKMTSINTLLKMQAIAYQDAQRQITQNPGKQSMTQWGAVSFLQEAFKQIPKEGKKNEIQELMSQYMKFDVNDKGISEFSGFEKGGQGESRFLKELRSRFELTPQQTQDMLKRMEEQAKTLSDGMKGVWRKLSTDSNFAADMLFGSKRESIELSKNNYAEQLKAVERAKQELDRTQERSTAYSNAASAFELPNKEIEAQAQAIAAALRMPQQELDNLKTSLIQAAQNSPQFAASMMQASGEVAKLGQEVTKGEAKLAKMNQTLGKMEGVQNFINRYIGVYAIVRKVTQFIKNAIANIKDLDKSITNIAIVTNMSQQELRGRVGEYTQMAQQYGVATKDVYTVSQLFYQQGLQTSQVMALTTETLKMAKVSGMDYTEATNAMTVAIRAFNIDMQEAAQVTDTYSALAAKFAVSSAEIANAMEKTASSAANVGMSLQSTSAFISVMEQTTREGAQNIGSALKSIISRYGEMKASPDKMINVDGEEVAFNKVDTALKSIGISIKDSAGQFRNFDDVIMELSAKWDTLDNNTQRYVATVMAGNRQQSRFIALVSNYDELKRAMNTANNAENAGIVQTAKAMDSLESKANQLKNAFSQLYLDLHFEDSLKGMYDWLTKIVTLIGKLGTLKGVLPTLFSVVNAGFGARGLINMGKDWYQDRMKTQKDNVEKLKLDKTEAENSLKEFISQIEQPREMPVKVVSETGAGQGINLEELKANIQAQAAELGLQDFELKARLNLADAVDPSILGQIQTALNSIDFTNPDWVVNFRQGIQEIALNAGELSPQLSQAFTEAGNMAIAGLIQGLSTGDTAAALVNGMGPQIIEALKAGLGEHSPSVPAHEAGDLFILGFVNGLRERLVEARQQATEAGTSVVEAFKQALEGTQLDMNQLINFIPLDFNMQNADLSSLDALQADIQTKLDGMKEQILSNPEGYKQVLDEQISKFDAGITKQADAEVNKVKNRVNSSNELKALKAANEQFDTNKNLADRSQERIDNNNDERWVANYKAKQIELTKRAIASKRYGEGKDELSPEELQAQAEAQVEQEFNIKKEKDIKTHNLNLQELEKSTRKKQDAQTAYDIVTEQGRAEIRTIRGNEAAAKAAVRKQFEPLTRDQVLTTLDNAKANADSTINAARQKKEAEAEAARRAKEEADRKAREEEERRAKEEADRKAREEAERKAQEEARYKAEQERLSREAMARVTANDRPSTAGTSSMDTIMNAVRNTPTVGPRDYDQFVGTVAPSRTPSVQTSSLADLQAAVAQETAREAAEKAQQVAQEHPIEMEAHTKTENVEQEVEAAVEKVENKEKIQVPVETVPAVSNGPTLSPDNQQAGQLRFDTSEGGNLNNLQVVPLDNSQLKTPEITPVESEQNPDQVTMDEILNIDANTVSAKEKVEEFKNETSNEPVTKPVEGDTAPLMQKAEEVEAQLESEPIERKIMPVNEAVSVLTETSGLSQSGVLETIIGSRNDLSIDATRQDIIQKQLGLTSDNSNYNAIDQFLQKISQSDEAFDQLYTALDEAKQAEQVAAEAAEQQAEASKQHTEKVKEDSEATGEETKAREANKDSIEQQTSTRNGAAGLGGISQGLVNGEKQPGLFSRLKTTGHEKISALSERMNSSKYSILHTKWKTNEEGKQTGRMATSLAANVAKMIAPAIIAAAPNFAAKSNKEINNNTMEGDKIVAGFGQGLSGAATGAQMGMAFGPWGAAIGAVGGFLINGFSSIWDGLHYTIEEKYADSKKILEQAQQENQKQQAKITELSSSIDNLKNLRKAMYDSKESMQEYADAMNTLGQQYPDLISGYDAAGNAIVNITSAEEKLAEIRKDGARAATVAAEAKVENLGYGESITEQVALWSQYAMDAFDRGDWRKKKEYLDKIQKAIEKNPELFNGQTDLSVIAGLGPGEDLKDIETDRLEKIRTFAYGNYHNAQAEFKSAKKELETTRRNEELTNTISNSTLTAAQKNELESDSSYSALYDMYRTKKGGNQDVSKEFLRKVMKLTESQREKLSSVDYAKFNSMDELLDYFDLQLSEDDTLYKTFNQLLTNARQENLERFISTIFNTNGKDINSNLLGLQRLLKNKNHGTWGTTEIEYTTLEQIQWLKNRFSDGSEQKVLSIYSDFVTDQLMEVNRFAEDGYTALAQARLNALDQMMYLVGKQEDEIQADLFEKIVSIDFSNPEEINKTFDEIANYASEHEDFQQADRIEVLRQSILSSINYNLNTIYENAIQTAKNTSEKLNASLSINKSGIDFSKAVKEFEDLVNELGDSNLSFDDLFVFDPILKQYIMTEEGLEKTIAAKRAAALKEKTDTEAKIAKRKELMNKWNGTKVSTETITRTVKTLDVPEWHPSGPQNRTYSSMAEWFLDWNGDEVTKEDVAAYANFANLDFNTEDSFIDLPDEYKSLVPESVLYNSEKGTVHIGGSEWTFGTSLKEMRKSQQTSLDILSDIATLNWEHHMDDYTSIFAARELMLEELFFNSDVVQKNIQGLIDNDERFKGFTTEDLMSEISDALGHEDFQNKESLIAGLQRAKEEDKNFIGPIVDAMLDPVLKDQEVVEYTAGQNYAKDREGFETRVNELLNIAEDDNASKQILQELIEEFYNTVDDDNKKLEYFFGTWLAKKMESDIQLAKQIEAIYEASEKDFQNTLFQNIEWEAVYTPNADLTGRNERNMNALAKSLGLYKEGTEELTETALQQMAENNQSLDEFIYSEYLKTLYTMKVLDDQGNEVLDKNNNVVTEFDAAGYQAAMDAYLSEKKTNLAQSAKTAIDELLGGTGTKLSDTTRGFLKKAQLDSLDNNGLLEAGNNLVQSAIQLYNKIESNFNTVTEANEAYTSILKKKYESANQAISTLSSGASLDIDALATTFSVFGLELSEWQDINGNWINGMQDAIKTDQFGKTQITDWDALINIISTNGVNQDRIDYLESLLRETEDQDYAQQLQEEITQLKNKQASGYNISQLADTFEYQNAYSSYVDGIISLDTQFKDLIKKSYDNAFNSISLFKEMNVSQIKDENIINTLTANGAATISGGILTVTNALEYARNAQSYFATLSTLNARDLYDQTGWTAEDLAKNWKAAQTVITQSKDAWTSIGSNLIAITSDQISTLIEKGNLDINQIGEGKLFKPIGDHYVMALSDYALELAKSMSISGIIDSAEYNKAFNQAAQGIINNISGLDWTKVLDGTATNVDLDTFKQGLVENLTVLGSSLGENYQEIIENVKSGQLNVTELVNALSNVDEALANHIKETIAEIQNDILSSISSVSGYVYQGTNNISDMQKFVDEYNKLVDGANISIESAFEYDTDLNQFTLNANMLNKYIEAQKQELAKLGMQGPAIEAYIKDQTEALIRQNMDITSILDDSDKIAQNKAIGSLQQQIVNWIKTTGTQLTDKGVESYANSLISRLYAGGAKAVEILQKIKGDEVTQEEISAVYNAGLNRIIAAQEALEAGVGEVLTGIAAEIATHTEGIETIKLADGTVVVTSITNMAQAYANLYSLMQQDSAKTTESLNNLYAKFLTSIDQPEIDMVSTLNDAMGMSYEALGQLLTGYGKSLEEYILHANQYGLKSLGNGTVQIYDFDKFAASMKWKPGSDAYIDARKAYNQSLIELDKKFGESLTEEIKNISQAKAGDKIEISYFRKLMSTYTSDPDGLLAALFKKYGAAFENGILTLSENADIPGLIQQITNYASEYNWLLPEELAELSDVVSDYIKDLIDLIKNGISGSLNNVQAQKLQSWADQFNIKLDFTKTAEGLKISTNQAIELYNKVKDIDQIQSKLLFDELNNNLKETNEHYKDIGSIRARIVELEKVDNRSPILERELELAKEILAVRSTSEDEGFNFMSNKIPGAQNNPLNYYSNWAKAIQTLDTAFNKTAGKNKGLIDYQDWYNIVNELNNFATEESPIILAAGKELDGSMESASALIEEGALALTTTDTGEIKVDLNKLGINFKAGVGGMSDGIDSAMDQMADSQIKMLDGMIRLLEVIVQMESLGDITGENNTIDFEDFFKITGDETAGLNTANENVTKWVNELLKLNDKDSDLYKALDQIKINNQSLRELLQSAKEGNINIEDAEALTSVLNSLWQMYQSGEWDLDNLYESLAQIAEESGLGGELTLNIDDTTLIISGGKITQIDWQDANTKDVLAKWEETYKSGKEGLTEAISKYMNNEELDIGQAVLVLKYQEKLKIVKGDVIVSINGEEKNLGQLGDEQQEYVAKWIMLQDAGYKLPEEINWEGMNTPIEIGVKGRDDLEYTVYYDDDYKQVRYKMEGLSDPYESLDKMAIAWWNAEHPDEEAITDFSENAEAKRTAYYRFGQSIETTATVTVKDTNVELKNPGDIRDSAKAALLNDTWKNEENFNFNKETGELTVTLGEAKVVLSGTEFINEDNTANVAAVERYIREEILGMDIGLGETISDAITESIPSIIDSLNSVDATGPEKVATALANMYSALNDLQGVDYEVIANGLKALGFEIPDTVEVGKQAVDGIAEGIDEEAESGRISESTDKVANATVDSSKTSFVINSPSEIMMPVGQFVTAGIAEGMKQGSGEIAAAASELVNAAIEGVTSTIQAYNASNGIQNNNAETKTAKSTSTRANEIDFNAMKVAIAEISSSMSLASSNIVTGGVNAAIALNALIAKAQELSRVNLGSSIIDLTSQANSLKTALYWLDYWADQSKEHIHVLGDYAGQSEWFVRDHGDASAAAAEQITLTIEPIKLLGEKALEAQDHVSKFGELTGGAESPVVDLASAAGTAAEQLSKIKFDISGVDDNSTLEDGKLEITIDQDTLSEEAQKAKKTIDSIKQTQPVQVDVTDGGTIAAIQKAIDSVKDGSATVYVKEVYQRDPDNPKGGSEIDMEARGNVGEMVARAKGTLMGELGPELVVSNGRYFVAGQNGAEFVDLDSDAIVFNHLQTRSLFKNGMSKTRGRAVTNERSAVAFARGNVTGGPAKASASAALSALKQLRAQWQALKDLSVKDLAGKGGGGGGGDPKAFIKDLEKWYNWLQQIAQLEKDINYQESLRNRIASDYNKDGLKYYQSQRKSLKDLTEEIQTQKSLLSSQEDYFKTRQAELNKQSAFSALYGFSDSGQLYYRQGTYKDGKTAFEWLSDLAGRNTTTGEANYTAKEQYDKLIAAGFGFAMQYDSSGNKIDTSQEGFENTAIQAFWDKIEADKSEMQSLHDSIEDLSNSIESNTQKQNEILKAIEDNQISVENRVLAAIEDSRQRAIEEQRKERDAIEKTNSDLIKGLNDALAKERELYDNSEDNKELTSLQRQLSILQRSGGSAAEISSLQQEIASKQKDIYFELQQQQIDALQEASDKQLERLDRQIELEEETLEYQKANGLLWDQVYEVMAGTPEEITQFIADNTSEYWSKSEVALGQEVRQVEFEAEQWKAFSKEGDITTLLSSIADEVTRDTKEKQAKEEAERAAAAQAVSSGSGSGSGSSSGSGSGNNNNNNSGLKTWAVYDEKGFKTSYTVQAPDKDNALAVVRKEYGSYYTIGEQIKTDNSNKKDKQKTQEKNENNTSSFISQGMSKLQSGINQTISAIGTVVSNLFNNMGGKASGGYIKNPSIGFLAEEGEEAVLTAEQTRILRNDILSNSPNSLLNLLQDFRAAYAEVGNTTNIANAGSSVVIEHAEVNMHVDQLANGYDSARAADDVMKEMLNIARKTNAQNRVGR